MYMWHHAGHMAIQVVPARGFVAYLGNSMLMRFGHIVSEAHHWFLDVTSSGGAVTSCVTSWHRTCTGHVTFYYKRSANASFEALFGSVWLTGLLALGLWFIHQVCPCHPHTAGV